MPKAIDIKGKRYSRLTVLSFSFSDGKKRYWKCRCDCGNITLVPYGHLKYGNTRSCGCLLKDRITKHGKCKTKTFKVWIAMLDRCRNEKNRYYYLYGGRGISVCERWKEYVNFYADMGDAPEGLTIERIDTNGDYSPENCKWATPKDQANNRRSNRWITFNGRTQTLTEWCAEVGLTKSSLIYRLNAGWPVDKALTLPSDRSKNNVRTKARRTLYQKYERP